MITNEYLNTSMDLFEQALKVADDENIASRIQLSALPVMYLKCMRSAVAARNDGTYSRVLDIIAKEGITHLAEYNQSLERFKKFVEEAR